jgi:division protein CdvB (Snf7/Vps24/ESCRT-III family)
MDRIDSTSRELEDRIKRLEQRGRLIQDELRRAYDENRMLFASMYASELIEVREIVKSMSFARLGMVQISLRLRTLSQLGDVVAILAPAIETMREIGSSLQGIFPEAESELSEIGNMLSGIMIEAGQGSGMTLNFDLMNEDVSRILTEASTVAEQRIREKFPDLPPGMPDIPTIALGEKTSADTTRIAQKSETVSGRDANVGIQGHNGNPELARTRAKKAAKKKIIEEAMILAKQLNAKEERSLMNKKRAKNDTTL